MCQVIPWPRSELHLRRSESVAAQWKKQCGRFSTSHSHRLAPFSFHFSFFIIFLISNFSFFTLLSFGRSLNLSPSIPLMSRPWLFLIFLSSSPFLPFWAGGVDFYDNRMSLLLHSYRLFLFFGAY